MNHSATSHCLRRAIAAMVFSISPLFIGARHACADIIHVYEGQSIQAAIDGASNGDEIIVHPGTYYESINFIGKAVWLHSQDGPIATTLHVPANARGVNCISGEGPDTIVEGFTVTGANVPDWHGGGMSIGGSSPSVINCIFADNIAHSGSGMVIWGGDPTVAGCVFAGNSAVGLGLGAPVGDGGAIYAYASPTIVNCVFRDNYANRYGGAIAIEVDGPEIAEVINCTIVENHADASGGAVANYWEPSPQITNCIIWDNSTPQLYNNSATPSVTYCCVMGGYYGVGNISTNPTFIYGSPGDFHLSPYSPCIDAGNSDAVPEGITTDLDGNPRFLNHPTIPDTGVGYPCVDMGAYEFQAVDPCPADVTGDGTVDVLDLLYVLAQWGMSGVPSDINGDGIVNVLDLLDVLAAWGPCQ